MRKVGTFQMLRIRQLYSRLELCISIVDTAAVTDWG